MAARALAHARHPQTLSTSADVLSVRPVAAPTIPASFLTFSTVPLYPVYGDAALAFGPLAVADQTIAGVIMKLGGGLLLWSTIAVIWFRWTKQEREEWERLESTLRAS